MSISSTYNRTSYVESCPAKSKKQQPYLDILTIQSKRLLSTSQTNSKVSCEDTTLSEVISLESLKTPIDASAETMPWKRGTDTQRSPIRQSIRSQDLDISNSQAAQSNERHINIHPSLESIQQLYGLKCTHDNSHKTKLFYASGNKSVILREYIQDTLAKHMVNREGNERLRYDDESSPERSRKNITVKSISESDIPTLKSRQSSTKKSPIRSIQALKSPQKILFHTPHQSKAQFDSDKEVKELISAVRMNSSKIADLLRT